MSVKDEPEGTEEGGTMTWVRDEQDKAEDDPSVTLSEEKGLKRRPARTIHRRRSEGAERPWQSRR